MEFDDDTNSAFKSFETKRRKGSIMWSTLLGDWVNWSTNRWVNLWSDLWMKLAPEPWVVNQMKGLFRIDGLE